jgi:Domain of unknown function (DUF222)/HNH endonuclease
MKLLDERPVWSMSGGEKLSALDAVNAEIARLKTRGLHLVAGLEDTGYAKEIGAHDTARLLAARYRIDSVEAYREVRLARALPKYPAVTAALPDTTPPPDLDGADTASDGAATDGAVDAGGLDGAGLDGVAAEGGAAETAGGADGWPLHPAQAQAIVWALERVASRVPPEHLAVAEEQLVNLAGHLSPGQLRTAGKEIGDLLDSDGPQPDEDKAYGRESLTLANAENGVKFRGFLANENAELLRSITHAGARPHKTLDGELDPRPREKRQADALTTALTIAAAATDTGGHTPPAPPAAAAHPANTDPTNTDPTNTGLTDAAAGAAQTTAAPGTATGTGTGTATTGMGADTATGTGNGTATTGGMRTAVGTTTGLADPATATTDTTGTAAIATTGTGTGAAAATGTGAAATGVGTAGWVPGFGAKANITVTIDFNDLKAATADATGQLVYGDALSAAAIRRLACDAKILPLVLGSNSEPLDVGRSERLVNRAMRRALNARDKGCVVCGAPPIQCDAHHVQSWIDGGPTAVNNLVLLCRRHRVSRMRLRGSDVEARVA